MTDTLATPHSPNSPSLLALHPCLWIAGDVQISFGLLGTETCLSFCRKPVYTAAVGEEERLRKQPQL